MDNFTTEFNGKLAHHLDRGQYFEIELLAIDNPKRLHISLTKEKLNKNPETDIGLHVIVNFVENQITANSRYGGEWVNAIAAECNISARLKGPIKITIQLWEESFNIAINGVHKVALYYCGNIHLLEAIQIEDDIKRITRLDHRNTYPQPWPPWYVRAQAPNFNYFSNDMPVAPHQGLMVAIRVRCYGEMGRLIINTKHEREGKVFAHFSIRFDENVVVRNNKLEGSYGIEERDGGFPFDFAREFRIGIACGEKAFLVAVNGSKLCTFTYREELDGYNLSSIGGFHLHATHGLIFKVTEIDYIQLNGPECKDFEMNTMN